MSVARDGVQLARIALFATSKQVLSLNIQAPELDGYYLANLLRLGGHSRGIVKSEKNPIVAGGWMGIVV